jgi:hypothetical protein
VQVESTVVVKVEVELVELVVVVAEQAIEAIL